MKTMTTCQDDDNDDNDDNNDDNDDEFLPICVIEAER